MQRTVTLLIFLLCFQLGTARADHLRDLQQAAIRDGKADWGHWGPRPDRYSSWQQHTNRLIPIYSFGMTLDTVDGANSVYHDAARIKRLYGRLPEETLNPAAKYFDQTAIYQLQKQAADAGKKYIVLLIFDGMDWQTTQAASIALSERVGYDQGRGSGLHIQDYRGAETDFGYFVTSPHNHGTQWNVDAQTVTNIGGKYRGGYAAGLGGNTPWSTPTDPLYIIGQSRKIRHAYTDSAASATSMNSGIKTYNRAVNVDFEGHQVVPISRQLQAQGRAIGVVTSVPVSHATPACAYGNNVARYDYQDISRDLLGLRSVAHKTTPLPGVDVLLGAGWGHTAQAQKGQGANYVPGNVYLSKADLDRINLRHGGGYVVVQRKPGINGNLALMAAAREAREQKTRLFGMFGVGDQRGSHLPYRTADGRYNPTDGVHAPAEPYRRADIFENPTLADMTRAALEVLGQHAGGFWLMVEAGDVDWANHTNNIDNSVGAVKSGDDAFRVITDWIERHDAWSDAVVLVTADHGHYLQLDRPERLIDPAAKNRGSSDP